jgi:cell division protein ZipA
LAQLRWILAGLGAVAIAAIWWWSTRRSGQAPGNSELRESTVVPLQSLAPAAEGSERGSADWSEVREHAEPRDRTDTRHERAISPLEPLSIRTADFERVPILDLPMKAHRQPEHAQVEEVDYMDSSMSGLSGDPNHSVDIDIDIDSGDEAVADVRPTQVLSRAEPRTDADSFPDSSAAAAPPPRATAAASSQAPLNLAPGAENSDRLAAVEPPAANLSEQQKIVTLRVCAVGDERWSGRDLMAVLEGHGLAFGRYQVYHRKHADGQSIFYVASLIEPGTFDAATMPEQEFRGVSMFAVLPGPLEPLHAVDALLAMARELARELSGTIQDAKGMPFSPQRIATLREDVARFQALLNPSALRPAAGSPA